MAYRLALLGDPVDHSRSPAIHRILLELSDLDGEYTTVRADRARLVEAIAGLRSGYWDGLNVTMPLKADAAELADRLAPEAARAASVNTLVRVADAVVGHSTDAVAFSALLGDPRFEGAAPIHLLGAGGSAAAALAAIADSVDVYLSARRPEAAWSLVHRMGTDARPRNMEVLAWGTAVAGALLVNTTPLGMEGESLPRPLLEGARGLIDLPYGPAETPAAALARQRGLPLADGNEFLVRQAMASFTIWTGADPSYPSVVTRLRKA